MQNMKRTSMFSLFHKSHPSFSKIIAFVSPFYKLLPVATRFLYGRSRQQSHRSACTGAIYESMLFFKGEEKQAYACSSYNTEVLFCESMDSLTLKRKTETSDFHPAFPPELPYSPSSSPMFRSMPYAAVNPPWKGRLPAFVPPQPYPQRSRQVRRCW